jgi:hypothetical protein
MEGEDMRSLLFKLTVLSAVFFSMGRISAAPAAYDDMGAMAGVDNAFWNTTGRIGIDVDSSVSATAVCMDTFTWTSAESSPSIKMNTKPYVSLKFILR